MTSGEIRRLKQALDEELADLETKRVQIDKRTQSGNRVFSLSAEDGVIFDRSAQAAAKESARAEIDRVLKEGERTERSGLSKNAEEVLKTIDHLGAGLQGGVGKTDLEEELGFGDPYLGSALRLLKEAGLIDGVEVAEVNGPLSSIFLTAKGRDRLASTMKDAPPLGTRSGTPKAFLLMPFVTALDWLHAVIRQAGHDAGVEVERADDIARSGAIIEQVKEQIREAAVIIAVCTGTNPNVFYELGYSENFGSPILVAERKQDLPFDIHHLRTIFYAGTEPNQNRETMRERLASAIRQTLEFRKAPQDNHPAQTSVAPRLDARVMRRSGNQHAFRIENTGGLPLAEVEWEIGPDGQGWSIMGGVLPKYPIENLDPGESVSVPTILTGAAGATNIVLKGREPGGTQYSRTKLITPWE